MKNILAVYLKELKVYFSGPIAYFVAVIFLIVSGIFFVLILNDYARISFEIIRANYQFKLPQLNVTDGIFSPMFHTFSFLLLLMTPLLTMKSFSEEKKTGTIELVLTYPLRDTELVLGKLSAVLTVYISMLLLTASYGAMILYFKAFSVGVPVAGYLGLLLLGFAFISLGIFISSLTENQIIAAAVSFGAIMFFWLIGAVMGDSTMPIADILRYISLREHFHSFTVGVIDTRDVAYYLSFGLLFILATLRVLESRRYRG